MKNVTNVIHLNVIIALNVRLKVTIIATNCHCRVMGFNANIVQRGSVKCAMQISHSAKHVLVKTVKNVKNV